MIESLHASSALSEGSSAQTTFPLPLTVLASLASMQVTSAGERCVYSDGSYRRNCMVVCDSDTYAANLAHRSDSHWLG